MKKLLIATLKATPAIQDIFDRRIYQANATGMGDIPEKPPAPFMAVKEMPTITFPEMREISKAQRHFFQVFVHDKKGSYSRIDSGISVLRDTVMGLVGQVSVSGARCHDVVWNGSGADSVDDFYDTFLKICTFEMTSDR